MKLSGFAKDLLASTAPTLLTALSLPPPFNVIAAGVVSAALKDYAPADMAARARAGGRTAAGMSPEELAAIADRNATDPQFVVALQKAEAELKKYETEAGLRFAEIELKDRERAGNIQTSAGVGEVAFKFGMLLVWTALIGMLLMVLGLLLVVAGWIPVRATEGNEQLLVAAFGLIGTAVGFVNGIAGTVVAFYWGSSRSSEDKTQVMKDSMSQFGAELAKMASRQPAPTPEPPKAPPPPATAPSPTVRTLADEDMATPATPAGFGLEDVLPELTTLHRHFEGSVRWKLTPEGISIEGAKAGRTNGPPDTITKIWKEYGDICATWAKRYRVPVELIVATIATESGGNPRARRAEPQIRDESVGLMQTLVETAQRTLGRRSITGDDLMNPELSIEAGTAYIAQQRNETDFDPPRVAAAYNAGSLRPDNAAANRWRLHCYPKGTGRHIENYVNWFGDAMRVSAANDWSAGGTVPSYAYALRPRGGGGGLPVAGDGDGDGGGGAATQVSGTLATLSGTVTLAALARDDSVDLAKEVQGILTDLGYLDPPPDGQFREISSWALRAFCVNCGIPWNDEITDDLRAALFAPPVALPFVPKQDDWHDRVFDYMAGKGYWISRYPGCMNIVYLEGLNPDGTLNDNKPDAFNDLRMLFWLGEDGLLKVKSWEATTEPGSFWVENPMVDKGAARIAFGQFKSWSVGTHLKGKASEHEALVQTAPVPVHRDLNKDFQRANDKIDVGIFGINQHWGYDHAKDEVGKASAGCLVGRTKAGHLEFMNLLKSDPRYKVNPNYRFLTTIIPAHELF